MKALTWHGGTAFQLAELTDPGQVKLQVVTNWEDWEAWDCEWQSPFQLCHAGLQVGSVCLVAKGEAMPLLQLAARKCFWSLPLHFLHQVEKELGLPQASGLYETLKSLVENVVKPSEEELVDILAMRLRKSQSEYSTLLKEEILQEALPKDHLKEVEAPALATAVLCLCSACALPWWCLLWWCLLLLTAVF